MTHRGYDPDAYTDSPSDTTPMDVRECPFCGAFVKMLPSHLPDCEDAPA